MLAKKYRLPIQQFYAKGRAPSRISQQPTQAVSKNSFFIVRTKQSALPFPRFGVVVGSKVDKRAARRNFIRRVIYSWIQLDGLHRFRGKDVMILVLPLAKDLNKKDLISALQDILD